MVGGAGEGGHTSGASEALQAIESAVKLYSRWRQWGPTDQLGALNFIDAAKVRQAAALVRRGVVFSLALPFDQHGPQDGKGGRFNPIHTMLFDGSDAVSGAQGLPHGYGKADDAVYMALQSGTQWDALSHIFDRGRMWNGYSASEVSSYGATRNGIEHTADRLVSRGVLLDVARAQGVPTLEPGYAITEADLEQCIAAQGPSAEVGRGDIVLIRTGQLAAERSLGWPTYCGGPAPGLSFWTVGWLHRTEIAGIASDTWGVEVRPNEFQDSWQPLHQVMIPHLGLTVGEIFDLETLAEDCAASGSYEFLLAAPSLPFTGAVATLVNPLAIT